MTYLDESGMCGPITYEDHMRRLEAAVRNAIAMECERCARINRDNFEALKSMLAEVGKWGHRGRSVAEEFDILHGAGSWRRALRSNAEVTGS